MAKIPKSLGDAVEDAIKAGKVASTAKSAKVATATLPKVTPKASRVVVSPLEVRGSTPSIKAQNAVIEKVLPKEQVRRVADAIQEQNRLNELGVVVPMSDLGVSPIDILAFQNARQLAGATPSSIKTFNSFLDRLDLSGMRTDSPMPLGSAEELRKAVGMEAGQGITDTSAPLYYTNSRGESMAHPTGVSYNALFDGWANAKSARPKHPLSSVILQGAETRPIALKVREDGSFVPQNLSRFQVENQIDAPVGSIDTRGMDFPEYATDAYMDTVRQSLTKGNRKDLERALIQRSFSKNWDKEEMLAQKKSEGKTLVDKGIPSEQLQLFRDLMKRKGLDSIDELFATNRKFRKLVADTLSAKDTTRGLGIPHYNSFANSMLADPVKRTQMGQTAQLILRPVDEGIDVKNMSPDYQYEYDWHTPTDLVSNLFGQNVPRSLMYRTGIEDVMRRSPELTGSQAQNSILISTDKAKERVLLAQDVEEAIKFSNLWKKATSGQGLTQAESDELLRLDALRRYQY